MAVRTNLIAPLALFAACSHPDPYPDTKTRPSALQACGLDGHVLPAAAPGDLYVATDPLIQSSVVSNGVVTVELDGDSWSFAVVSRTSQSVPLVIQLRDIEHRTLCTELN